MASSNHDCTYMPGMDLYRIAWTVDYKYKGSRLRFPRRMDRYTDERRRAGVLQAVGY